MSNSARGLRVNDIGHMALIITLPHIGASTLSSFILGLVNPASIVEDIPTVLNFILISFPLTLATALIVIAIIEKELTFVIFITIIIISGILSNLLALLIPNAVYANHDMMLLFDQSSRTVKGPLMFVVYAYKIVSIWWESYTILLFIQSIIIGSWFGYRFASRK
jgi:hypothetical protein